MKKTYGLGLNDRNPVDAELMRRLEQVANQADLLRTALLVYFDQGNQPLPITDQELAGLRAEVAWLRQNQAAPVTVAAQPDSQANAVQAQPGGELSEVFLNGIRKIAKPGLRLET